MSSPTPRPGLALGPYPERTDSLRRGFGAGLDRTFAAAAARRRARRARLDTRVAAVLAAAEALEGENDVALGRRARELGARLRREGLAEALVSEAFALVREIAGRTLGMRHHPAQIRGGLVLLDGMLAEMETGEGKTLTATLPAATAALAGIPVHVVTVNDYLVARDAKEMQPVYEALGLRVGAVTAADADPAARRAAYACDVTYATNKQLAFDYLRDRLTRGGSRGRLALELGAGSGSLLLRGLCFAIVDEADSVLVDEARTPLVLSREVPAGDEERTAREAVDVARELAPARDYRVSSKERRAELTDAGRSATATRAEALGPVWRGARRREELVCRALEALHAFHKDHDYLVRDGRVEIIDPHTGRTMPDRSWERGLHAMIEVKEDCEVTGRRETLARISYQRFFRRYLRLAGMTGTAREVAGELVRVYGLPVVPVPTHRPLARRIGPERVHASAARKWQAVLARTRTLHAAGRPVLIGTASVEASEALSARLTAAGLPHEVLNAREDHREAEVVARAGEPGRITVATRMAGRGTDIRLGAGVAERGGLHVIATERSEARRIDRQLRGRCGRQGDPGSTEAHVSLEDEPVGEFYPATLVALLHALAGTRGFSGRGARWLMCLPQIAVERRHERMRRALFERDDELARILAFTGAPE